MSKAKDAINELRNKVFERKKEEIVEAAQKEVAATLEQVAIDVIQDPDVKSRSFLMVKIKYDLKTKEAVVQEVRQMDDKTAGLGIVLDKKNMEYFYNKGKVVKK